MTSLDRKRKSFMQQGCFVLRRHSLSAIWDFCSRFIIAMANSKEIGKAQKGFKELIAKAKELGLSEKDLLTLKFAQKHQKSLDIWPLVFRLFFGLLIAVLTLAGSVYLLTKYEYVETRKIAELYAKYVAKIELDEDNCIIPYHEFALDMFRPPVDCSFCEGVTKEDRVTNLTQEEFTDKYAYSGRPVVIIDGMKDWTAQDHFSFKFFKRAYKKGSPVLSGGSKDCQFFPYNTKFNGVKEVFRMPKKMRQMEGKPWYVGWSNCDTKAANIFRKHYSRPYFLSPDMESSKTDWIFMGTPGYGAHMHIDAVQLPSWQAQIKGVKKWTLQPPPECYYKCPAGFEVWVHPGEIVVLDTNRWFHQTDIQPGNMSITIGSEYD